MVPGMNESEARQYCFDNNAACIRRRTANFSKAIAEPIDEETFRGTWECVCLKWVEPYDNKFGDEDSDPDLPYKDWDFDLLER